LVNGGLERLSAWRRAEAEFVKLQEKKGDVALLVPDGSFQGALDQAMSLGIPVVVIAGRENGRGEEVVEAAQEAGICPACILVLRGGRVVALDGTDFGPALMGGKAIGVRAAAAAAERALKENLVPEPAVWVEEEEPLVFAEDGNRETAAKPRISEEHSSGESARAEPASAPPPTAFIGGFRDLLDAAPEVVAVFRTTPEVDGAQVARDLASALKGQHLELSAEPSSYNAYGRTPDEAFASGYLHSDGNGVKGEYGRGPVVVEIDLSVADPEALDTVYGKAKKVYHVADASEESVAGLKAWLSSGWRLDGVITFGETAARSLKKALPEVKVFPSVHAAAG
jgi:hypothetical protein